MRGICRIAGLNQPALWRFFGNRETHLRPISGYGTVRSVMDAPRDIVACRDQQRCVVRPKIREGTSRHVTANVLLGISVGASIGINPVCSATRQHSASSIGGGSQDFAGLWSDLGTRVVALLIHPQECVVDRARPVRNKRNTNVMRDAQLTRFNLDGCYPRVFGETRRRHECHPFDHVPGRSRLHGVRHSLQYDIRLRHPSVFRPFDCGRRVFGIALRSAVVRPLHDCVDLLLLQRTVVQKMTILGIGEPGRHLPRNDRRFHGFGPRTRGLVSQE